MPQLDSLTFFSQIYSFFFFFSLFFLFLNKFFYIYFFESFKVKYKLKSFYKYNSYNLKTILIKNIFSNVCLNFNYFIILTLKKITSFYCLYLNYINVFLKKH